MKMQKVNIERNKLTADGKFTIHGVYFSDVSSLALDVDAATNGIDPVTSFNDIN